MKFSKGFYAILFVTVFFLFSCVSSIRYTNEEIKDFPLDVQQKIIKGEVAPGMTPQQVRYAWGPPDLTKSLEPQGGKPREEWIYTSGVGIFKTKLIFVDGKLTYIISSEPGKFPD
jgi:hypothetical protein